MLEANLTSKASKQINSAALSSRRGRGGRGCCLVYFFLKLPSQSVRASAKYVQFCSHTLRRKFTKKYTRQQPLPPLPRLLF